MMLVRFNLAFAGFFLWFGQVSGFQYEENQTIKETLRFGSSSGAREVIVDNINGSIDVTGYAGRDVELVAYKTIRARSKEKLETAKRQISLDISEESGTIVLFVDAPWRQPDGSINYRGWRYDGYEVEFDFELKVPNETNIRLKTVNNGEIKVLGVRGDYELDNVNGGIEMAGATGSGRAYALNGELHVSFDRNPDSHCYFGSLNGEIEVAFQPDLSANLRFKTFNGEVYTDFPVTYLSPRSPSQKRANGKFVYKSDRSFGVKVGRGGPEIEFDGFNGNILVVKR